MVYRNLYCVILVFGPVVQLLTRPSVKEKTEDDLYGKGWEARREKLEQVRKTIEERDKREGKY